MSSPLSTQDLKQIHNGIRDKYAQVAVSLKGPHIRRDEPGMSN